MSDIKPLESPGWEVIHGGDLGRKVHVVPVNDSREHVLPGKCWCGTRLDDGVTIHNSADGREFAERAMISTEGNLN